MAAVPLARSSLQSTAASSRIYSFQIPHIPTEKTSPAFPDRPRRFSFKDPSAVSRPRTRNQQHREESPNASLSHASHQHFVMQVVSQRSSRFSTRLGSSSLPRSLSRPSHAPPARHASLFPTYPPMHPTRRFSQAAQSDGGVAGERVTSCVEGERLRAAARRQRQRRRRRTACRASAGGRDNREDSLSDNPHSNALCERSEHSSQDPSRLLSSSGTERKPLPVQLLMAAVSSPSAPLKAAGAAVATATVIWLAAALRSTGVLPRVSLRSLLLPPPAHAAVLTTAGLKPSRLGSVAADPKPSKPGSDARAAAVARNGGGEEALAGQMSQPREQGMQEQQQQHVSQKQQQQQQERKAPQQRRRAQHYDVSGRTGVAPARYTAIVRFPKACGILVGTPVRMRGIAVGSVVAVRPSLTSVDVVIEILDEDIVIPRGTTVFVNQSGLIAETLIDMTPLLPIPDYGAGPRDAGCREEGLIVCHRERVEGEIGVSMDEMVRLCVKMARQAERERGKRSGGKGGVVVSSKV